MRTLAIGDVHGCYRSLSGLLDLVQPMRDDRLVFVGDYIDSGPESRQVVELLLALKKTCTPVFLRGNHEAMILEAREDPHKSHVWQSYGGLETVLSYGAKFNDDWIAAIPSGHWAFFEKTERFYENQNHIFVHACLDPGLDMHEQPDWLLYWEQFERLKPHKSGKRIVCGHTPQRSGIVKNVGYALCIDTGVATGGWLTCIDTQSVQVWQANEKGQTRTGQI